MSMWDPDALWLKAKVYMDRANALEHTDPNFGLWSALALELLARSALSKIHPALNADARDERNLFYAFGFPVVEQPRSIPAHSVYPRLEKLVPGFTKPQRDFCDYMGLLRNTELHTGEPAFARINAGTWLPRFYAVSKVLCQHLGKTLSDLLGDAVGAQAETIVTAFENAQEKAVKDKVAAHKKAFEARPAEERVRLSADAERLAMRLPLGTIRCACPVCGSAGLLTGQLIKELEPIYEEGELLIDQEYLATEFKCLACGLNLSSVDEIGLAGLDLRFTERTSTSLHEMFQPEFGDDYANM